MPEVLEKPRARTAKTTAKPTLGAATDTLWALREKKRAIDAQLKPVEEEIKAMEQVIFELLDAQDTRKAEGKHAAVSINESVVCNVDDWEALWPYIAKNKFFHLIQKRVSDPGMRELWALGKTVPGAQPFTKRTLSLKSL